MPTAKKLPSGSWRVRVYSHKENGKEVFKSFTASTKKEAELMALEWKNGKRHTTSLKVSEAIAGYIKAKTPVLSPSTVRGYNGMAARYFGFINDEKLDALTTEKLQLFVSDLAERVSPKTVRNVHGFLMSVIGFYLPDRAFKVTLPQMYKAITSAPSDGEIQALYEGANDTLQICIALSAFGSLRRGEISAQEPSTSTLILSRIRMECGYISPRKSPTVYALPRCHRRLLICSDRATRMILSLSGSLTP